MYLSINYIVFTILLYQCLTICVGKKNETKPESIGCSIPLPEKNDYESPTPNKVKHATSTAFRYGYVHFEKDEDIRLDCAYTQTISVKNIEKKNNVLLVKCVGGEIISYEGKLYEYKDIKCRGEVPNENSQNQTISTTEDPYATAVARNNAGFQDCYILLPDPDYNFMPIPFITNTTPAIIHPNKYGFFTIKANDEFKMTCADSEFISPVTGVSEVTVKCVTTTFLEFKERQYQFDRFRCKKMPSPKLVITDHRCQTDDCKVVKVGFETKSAFLVLYKICFDVKRGQPEYGWYHTISPMYKLRQVSTVKPKYIKTKTYGPLNVETLYSNQGIMIEKMLNSKKVASELINNEDRRYVTKTHLIAKSEFYYGFERLATYYLENTAPQWYRFSQGYWRDVERVFRRYMSESESHHVVVSGTYLTSTLPDEHGTPHLFYMSPSTKQMHVPQYFWKLNYDVNKSTGVVWIGMNNPTTRLNETMYLCDRMECPAKMQRKTHNKKLMYCCSKESFEKVYGRIDPVVFGNFNTIPPHP